MILAVLFIIILLLPAKDISPEAYTVRFSEAVEAGKWDKAMEHLQKCPQMGTAISENYLALIEGLISEGRIVEAENLFTGVVNHSRRITLQARWDVSLTRSSLKESWIMQESTLWK